MRYAFRTAHIGTLVWAAVLVTAAAGGWYLLKGKFHRSPRALSGPPHESFPMPPSTPDRG